MNWPKVLTITGFVLIVLQCVSNLGNYGNIYGSILTLVEAFEALFSSGFDPYLLSFAMGKNLGIFVGIGLLIIGPRIMKTQKKKMIKEIMEKVEAEKASRHN